MEIKFLKVVNPLICLVWLWAVAAIASPAWTTAASILFFLAVLTETFFVVKDYFSSDEEDVLLEIDHKYWLGKPLGRVYMYYVLWVSAMCILLVSVSPIFAVAGMVAVLGNRDPQLEEKTELLLFHNLMMLKGEQ